MRRLIWVFPICKCSFFLFFSHKCNNHIPTIAYIDFRKATLLPEMGSISPRLCDTRESDHLHRLFKSAIFLALVNFFEVVTITLQNAMRYMVKSIAEDKGGTPCADPGSFVRGGSNYNIFFCFLCFSLVDEGRENPNTTKSGSSSAG